MLGLLDPSASPRLRVFVSVCALSAASCTTPEPDPEGATESGAESGDADAGGPTTSAGGVDGSGSNATGGTSMDATGSETGEDASDDASDSGTGAEPVALPDDVFFFVREVGNGDALWAYDLAADQAYEATPLDSVAEISSVSIHPSRMAVAITSDYGAVDFQDSEAIYGFEVHADLIFDDPFLLMPAIPKPAGGVAAGYRQQLDELRWHPDGSWMWFGHAFQFDFTAPGGGTLGRADPATGEHVFFLDAVGGCSVNTAPSPSPDGSVVLAIRGVCTDGADEGLVAFDGPPAGEPVVLVPTSEIVFAMPQWLPDGSAIIYAVTIDYDVDGDGLDDVNGHALVLLEIQTGMQYVVLAPTEDAAIWDFTMAPAADRFVVCVSQAGARNLLLVDYTTEPPSTRWLTEDGFSCKPEW